MRYMKEVAFTMLSSLAALGASGQASPGDLQYELSNGTTKVVFHLPDPQKGFYRGTRFDWAGVIAELQSQGHTYFDQWFSRVDRSVHDFVWDGSDLVVGPCTGATGPVEEFSALGYDEAKAGGTFVKIGVGVLRKSEAAKYDSLHLYDMVDPGKWHIKKGKHSIEFIQDVHDASSGYGYDYEKTVELAPDKPVLTIKHQLTNRGARPILTEIYDHNFLSIDRQPPGPDIAIRLPFQIVPVLAPEKDLADFRGNQVVYLKTLTGEDRVYAIMRGFGESPADYNIRIESAHLGAGLTIVGDEPLKRVAVWSIRAVFAVEPFIEISAEPGQTATWTYEYTFGNPAPPAM
jgi:hypothetical protein